MKPSNRKKYLTILLSLTLCLLAGAMLSSCGGEDNTTQITTLTNALTTTLTTTPTTTTTTAQTITLTTTPTTTTLSAAGSNTASVTINENEAREILEAWLDEHKFQSGSNLEFAQGVFTINDTEYYRFTLDIVRFASAELLMDKRTGEMFHYYTPGWSDVFEPIDEWYNANHAGYLDSDINDAPNDMGWPGWVGYYMNADKTKALRIDDYNSRMEFFFELETDGRRLAGTAKTDGDTAFYMDIIFALNIRGDGISLRIDERQDNSHEREPFIDTYFRSDETIINEPSLS